MNKDELNATVLGDYEPILPDGWKEGDVLIPEDTQTEEAFLADEPKGLNDLLSENEDGAPETGSPTTAEEGEGQSQSAGAEDKGSSDGDKPEAKTSRILKLKVNHKEEVVDIDAMSDEDLVAALQKSKDSDRRVESDNQRRYREVYQEQIDAGNTDAVAKLVAKESVGGKTYSLTDEVETVENATGTAPASSGRDLSVEFAQLQVLFPEVKTLPTAVAAAAAKGVPMLDAYLAYQTKETEKKAAALKKENSVLRQNAASAAKAPVRGVTGGGEIHKEKDPFEAGFDSVDW